MEQIASNTFNEGLLMDMGPLTTPNTAVTDAINATITTFNGHEFCLQVDMGNARVETCRLKKDFIPLGIKEYGGIIYVVSQNPFTGDCEVGSFPSPERNITTEEIPDLPDTLLEDSDFYTEGDKSNGITITYKKIDLGDIENNLLRPGDKFLIYVTDESGANNYADIAKLYSYITTINDLKYEGVSKKNRVFKLHLSRIDSTGFATPIETETVSYKNLGRFFYQKDEAIGTDSVADESYYTVYNNKINGYLAIVVEIETISDFYIEIGNVRDAGDNLFDAEFIVHSTSNSYNNIYGVKAKVIPTDDAVTYNLVLEANLNSKVYLEESNDASVGYVELDGDNFQTDTDNFTNIPKENIMFKGWVKGLNKQESYTLYLDPYSRFGYNPALNYVTVLDYVKLTSAKASNLWRYKTEVTTDYLGQRFPQVSINFDFFTRGTLNGRHRCTAMYIEFYDVWSDASLIFPLYRVVSGSYTFTIPCFNDIDYGGALEPTTDMNGNPTNNNIFNASNRGGLILNEHIVPQVSDNTGKSADYYLLLDQTKSIMYLQAVKAGNTNIQLSKEDRKNLGLKTDKDYTGYDILNKLCTLTFIDGPCCIKLKAELTKQAKGEGNSYIYNNFSTSTDINQSIYSKLRYNNFYIARIIGLDIFNDSVSHDGDPIEGTNFRMVKYFTTNTIYTNGWYNDIYKEAVGPKNSNFTTFSITDFSKYKLFLSNEPEVEFANKGFIKNFKENMTGIVIPEPEEDASEEDKTYYNKILKEGYTIEGKANFNIKTIIDYSRENTFKFGELDNITNEVIECNTIKNDIICRDEEELDSMYYNVSIGDDVTVTPNASDNSLTVSLSCSRKSKALAEKHTNYPKMTQEYYIADENLKIDKGKSCTGALQGDSEVSLFFTKLDAFTDAAIDVNDFPRENWMPSKRPEGKGCIPKFFNYPAGSGGPCYDFVRIMKEDCQRDSGVCLGICRSGNHSQEYCYIGTLENNVASNPVNYDANNTDRIARLGNRKINLNYLYVDFIAIALLNSDKQIAFFLDFCVSGSEGSKSTLRELCDTIGQYIYKSRYNISENGTCIIPGNSTYNKSNIIIEYPLIYNLSYSNKLLIYNGSNTKVHLTPEFIKTYLQHTEGFSNEIKVGAIENNSINPVELNTPIKVTKSQDVVFKLNEEILKMENLKDMPNLENKTDNTLYLKTNDSNYVDLGNVTIDTTNHTLVYTGYPYSTSNCFVINIAAHKGDNNWKYQRNWGCFGHIIENNPLNEFFLNKVGGRRLVVPK